MGFHIPQMNSQHHLHMHIIVLPFKGMEVTRKFNEKVTYGKYIKSVDEVYKTCVK